MLGVCGLSAVFLVLGFMGEFCTESVARGGFYQGTGFWVPSCKCSGTLELLLVLP